jgi:hypothetical protein
MTSTKRIARQQRRSGDKSRLAGRLLPILALAAALALGVTGRARAADDDLKIELSLDRPVIELGRQASLTVSVNGSSGFDDPVIPRVAGLTFRSRGRTQSVRIINMKVKSSKVFGYSVEPSRAGEFTIGPVQIERRGKVYESGRVKLTVVDSAQSSSQKSSQKPSQKSSEQAEASRTVIVSADVDNSSPYVGQQVTLRFRFARKVGARIRNAGYELPQLPGFWNEGMESTKEYRQKIYGSDYIVSEVAIPLFPIRKGKINIDGVRFHYEEALPNERSRSRRQTSPWGGDSVFDSFFRRDRSVRREVFTDQIEIETRPLPAEGRPANFAGGVGAFSMKAHISDAEVNQGESVTLTVALSGQGNIRDIADPAIHIDGAKTYSDTPSINVKSYSDKVVGEKTYKVAVVPQGPDELVIPKFSTPYFNPETGRYEMASSEPLSLKVTPSGGEELLFMTSTQNREGRRALGATRRDILPIHERYGSIESSGLTAAWQKVRPVVYPLPALAFALCLAVVRRRERLRTDVEYRRRRFASKAAGAHIEAAAEAISRKDWDEVFTGCSRAITEYLADKLNIPAGGMTPSDVGDILAEKGMDEDFASEILRFLEGCDYGRFASPSESADAAARCVDGGRKILERLRREEAIK